MLIHSHSGCGAVSDLSKHVAKTERWLKWKLQGLEHGLWIESFEFNKGYLGFDIISQEHLDDICDAFNGGMLYDTKYVLGNSMGEILLGHNYQRELDL